MPPPLPHPLLEPIGALEALDAPAGSMAAPVRRLIPAGPVKDALSGSWLGHSLHPLLVVVPIGAWTSATVLDLALGRDSARASELLIGVGLVVGGPTTLTGWMDWSDSEPAGDEARRIGLLHGIWSLVALGLYGASLAARRRGRHATGVRLAVAGLGALSVSDWLGGDLAFARGVGVNHAAFDDAPQQWTPALDAGKLAELRPAHATVGGLELVLVRRHGRIYALADRCSHCGGALHQGELRDDCIACPRHTTRFRLSDGSLERGPSAYPQPAFETRVHDGRVEVRSLVVDESRVRGAPMTG